MSMVKLSGICDFFNGGAWSQNEFTEDGYPVLKVSNCKTNGFEIDSVSYIPYDIAQKSENNKLIVGDVIVATVGSHPNLIESAAGRSCVVTNEVAGFYLNQNAVCLRSKDQSILDQRYLGYLAASEPFKRYIQSRGKGAANQMRIAIGAIKEFAFNLPDIVIQRRIGSFLAAYDDQIENNQKQIKLLEEAVQRLYKEWFVDMYFPGYKSTPITDGIPDGWTSESILDNEVFKFVKSNVAPFEGKKQYYATADVSGTSIISAGEEVTFDNRPSRASIQPIPNSVWFARMSNSYKVLCCFGASEALSINAIISSGFAGFSSARETFGFVYATIASEFFDGEKNRYATGATQVSLTNEGLKKIKVLIPKHSTVVRYSQLVEPFLLKAEELKRQIKVLREARDRLLPKLMSGEIEV